MSVSEYVRGWLVIWVAERLETVMLAHWLAVAMLLGGTELGREGTTQIGPGGHGLSSTTLSAGLDFIRKSVSLVSFVKKKI